MSNSTVLNKFQEDLIAAGIDPDRYLRESDLSLNGMPRLKKDSPEGSTYACYYCERCGAGRFLWNLRGTSDGWVCMYCLGHAAQWLSSPPGGWSIEEALNV